MSNNNKNTAEDIAKQRTHSPNAGGVSADQVDKDQAAELKKAEDARKKRLIAAQKNKTKMVKMRAVKDIKLPRKTAETLDIPRDVPAGETVVVPGDVAEMFCTPVTGFYADEGGEWAGNNRSKHQVVRAEIVQ